MGSFFLIAPFPDHCLLVPYDTEYIEVHDPKKQLFKLVNSNIVNKTCHLRKALNNIYFVSADRYHGFLFQKGSNTKAMPIYDLNGNLAGIQAAVGYQILVNTYRFGGKRRTGFAV